MTTEVSINIPTPLLFFLFFVCMWVSVLYGSILLDEGAFGGVYFDTYVVRMVTCLYKFRCLWKSAICIFEAAFCFGKYIFLEFSSLYDLKVIFFKVLQ